MESGGLPPENFVEVMPFRMSENILLQNRCLISIINLQRLSAIAISKILISRRDRLGDEYWWLCRQLKFLKFTDWLEQWQRPALSGKGWPTACHVPENKWKYPN